MYIYLLNRYTFHRIYMIHDPLLYDVENEQPMQVKSMKLSDRFGQVTHIFSDKTGTITENVMNVKGVFCDGYEYLKENFEIVENENIKKEEENECNSECNSDISKPIFSSSYTKPVSKPLSSSTKTSTESEIENSLEKTESKNTRSDTMGRRTFNNFSRYISLTNSIERIDTRFSQIFDYHQSTISNYLTNYNGNEVFDLFLLNMSVNHSVYNINYYYF